MAQGNNENWKFYGAICVVVFIVCLCISPLYTIGIFWILATIYSLLIHFYCLTLKNEHYEFEIQQHNGGLLAMGRSYELDKKAIQGW